jgi:CBS domain-containing protein
LAVILEAAVNQRELKLQDVPSCSSDLAVQEALRLFPDNGRPLLVLDPEDPEWLVGIVTAFDLL